MDQALVVAALMGFVLQQQMIAQILGHGGIATTAQFADDADFNQTSRLEQRTDLFVTRQRDRCTFIGLGSDQAIGFQLLEGGTNRCAADIEQFGQG